MKQIFIYLLVICLGFSSVSCMQSLSQNKEKFARKDARKERKRLEKEGYTIFPGDLPIERQLETQYLKLYETDENGLPKYMFASATSVAGTEIAATRQATEAAKNLLAGQISTQVNELIEQKVANEQITRDEANTLTKMVSNSQNLISQNIGRVLTTSKFYREIGNDNLEVNITIAYSQELAEQAIRRSIQKELEKESDELGDKLEKILSRNE
jgi:hypothetical protein